MPAIEMVVGFFTFRQVLGRSLISSASQVLNFVVGCCRLLSAVVSLARLAYVGHILIGFHRVALNQSTDDVIGLHCGGGDLYELEEGLGHALGARGTGVALVNRVAQQFRQVE